MQIKSFITFILLFSSFCFGGWYECYNFGGTIGKYPIIMSLQIMDKAYSKADIYEVEGNYRYKSKNNPILLHGTFNTKDKKMSIFEYQVNLVGGDFYSNINIPHDSTAVFNFIFDTSIVSGTWINLKNNQGLPIALRLVSQFKDFSTNGTDSAIAIPQNFSTIDKYFVGEYVYDPTENERGKMITLKIYNKKTDSLLQIIDFSNYSVSMGNVSTPIHNNISITNNGFWIWADLGKMGTEIDYIFNIKKQKYKISKEGEDLLSE